ncbi:hypothetical protein [Sphingomonas sanxanigenens]|uniref:Uncharacterized protein n=1 Tax=Sphingomonas sanxanigenens DSM 19645 = NX02 TaxID=1123269 RepID=W0A6A4_9SPHN|nr:hypothetical protein [Sphingomonas sanxanigenens]AHE52586.1 hypothetical protein NX02_04185 [Sphingomonas sanxanigenens DSM 19645 = NX02]
MTAEALAAIRAVTGAAHALRDACASAARCMPCHSPPDRAVPPADELPLTDEERVLIGLAPFWPLDERSV